GEDAEAGSCGPPKGRLTWPAEHVFGLGDNRNESQDSRNLGPVSESDLVGRAFVVFWPRDHWQWL
ncbi:MAG: signal peptidase I, partial [Ilumatobacteraceae bacterium]